MKMLDRISSIFVYYIQRFESLIGEIYEKTQESAGCQFTGSTNSWYCDRSNSGRDAREYTQSPRGCVREVRWIAWGQGKGKGSHENTAHKNCKKGSKGEMEEKETDGYISKGTPMTARFNKEEHLKMIDNTFTPQSPIKTKEFFIGRIGILAKCMEVVQRPGAHIALYGNRGVGKTSLATILKPLCSNEGKRMVYFAVCDSVDTYESLWRKIFKDVMIQREVEEEENEFQAEPEPAFPQESYATFGPAEVMDVVRVVGGSPVIILDEFDRLAPNSTGDYFPIPLNQFPTIFQIQQSY